MNATKTKVQRRQRRRLRTRKHLRGTAGRPRLAVFRSLKHIYAQVIDDGTGRTLVSCSTVDKDLRESLGKKTSNQAAAQAVGAALAARALQAGIESVAFDRGGFLFHGRVKAVADAARKGGLKF